MLYQARLLWAFPHPPHYCNSNWRKKTIKQSPPGNQLSVPMCVLLKHYIQLQRPNTNINQKSFWRLEESPKRQLETYREEQSWHKLSSEQMWRLHLKPGITWWTEVPDSHATHILPFVRNADLRQSLFVTVKYPREGGSRTDQPHRSMMGGSPWNITSRHRINSAFFNIRYQKYFLVFFLIASSLQKLEMCIWIRKLKLYIISVGVQKNPVSLRPGLMQPT